MVVFNLVSIVSILFSHLLDNKTTIIDGAAALGLGMVTIICTASQATIRSNAAAPCTGGAGSDWMAENNSWGYRAQQRELETGV